MATVFLYLFFVGFGLTVASAILGMVDVGGDGHVGHGGHGHGTHGHTAHGHGHSGDGAHGHNGSLDNARVYGDTSAVSPINFQTIVAFLMGFGGIGYLAARFGLGVWALGIPLAMLPAIAGGAAVGWLLFHWQRFLVRGERPLPPTSYIGLVGRLTVSIRLGGTGEMVYAQHGTRMVTAARSERGEPIAKGEEVVVLRYEKGIAYVRLLRELMSDQDHKGGTGS